MKFVLGDVIIVKTPTTSNGSDEQPAIVNRVWGEGDTRDAPQCVNCTVLPDGGVPFSMSSVLVHDVKPVNATPNMGWLPRTGPNN